MRISPNPGIFSYKNAKIHALGNQLLNLWYCCNLAYRHGYELTLPCRSDIEGVLDHNLEYRKAPKHEWEEGTAWTGDSLDGVVAESKAQYLRSADLLISGVSQDTTLCGNYWHFGLRNVAAIDYYCKFKQSEFNFGQKEVVVHFRGTDFKTHLPQYFKEGQLVLTRSYYLRAFEFCRQRLGPGTRFVIISDDFDEFSRIVPEILDENEFLRYVISINCGYESDWLALYTADKIICSNSTFCWTAALFNKSLRVMPQGGYLHQSPERGSVPFGFEIAEDTTHTFSAQNNKP